MPRTGAQTPSVTTGLSPHLFSGCDSYESSWFWDHWETLQGSQSQRLAVGRANFSPPARSPRADASPHKPQQPGRLAPRLRLLPSALRMHWAEQGAEWPRVTGWPCDLCPSSSIWACWWRTPGDLEVGGVSPRQESQQHSQIAPRHRAHLQYHHPERRTVSPAQG